MTLDHSDELPPLLRVPDLAAHLSLTRNGVRALLARGELPASKVGRQWIVRREALLAHLRAGERARRPPPDPVAILDALTRGVRRRRHRRSEARDD